MAHQGCKIEGPCGKAEFGVTQLPNRKTPCLYRMRGAMLEPLAYFRCEEDAEAFDKIVDVVVDTLESLTHNATAHVRAVASNVQQIVGGLK